jgi:hypothetical protein
LDIEGRSSEARGYYDTKGVSDGVDVFDRKILAKGLQGTESENEDQRGLLHARDMK